jgi:hypothetical protein
VEREQATIRNRMRRAKSELEVSSAKDPSPEKERSSGQEQSSEEEPSSCREPSHYKRQSLPETHFLMRNNLMRSPMKS